MQNKPRKNAETATNANAHKTIENYTKIQLTHIKQNIQQSKHARNEEQKMP